MRAWLGLVFGPEISSGDSTGNETDRLPAVKLILCGPVPGSGFTLGPTLGPDLLVDLGKTAKNP